MLKLLEELERGKGGYQEEKKLNTIRLQTELIRNDLTQRKLGEKVGVTEVSVSRYIHGSRMPRANTLVKMAKALHTTPEYLAGIEDEKDHQAAFYQVLSMMRVHEQYWDKGEKIALIQKLLDGMK